MDGELPSHIPHPRRAETSLTSVSPTRPPGVTLRTRATATAAPPGLGKRHSYVVTHGMGVVGPFPLFFSFDAETMKQGKNSDFPSTPIPSQFRFHGTSPDRVPNSPLSDKAVDQAQHTRHASHRRTCLMMMQQPRSLPTISKAWSSFLPPLVHGSHMAHVRHTNATPSSTHLDPPASWLAADSYLPGQDPKHRRDLACRCSRRPAWLGPGFCRSGLLPTKPWHGFAPLGREHRIRTDPSVVRFLAGGPSSVQVQSGASR